MFLGHFKIPGGFDWQEINDSYNIICKSKDGKETSLNFETALKNEITEVIEILNSGRKDLKKKKESIEKVISNNYKNLEDAEKEMMKVVEMHQNGHGVCKTSHAKFGELDIHILLFNGIAGKQFKGFLEKELLAKYPSVVNKNLEELIVFLNSKIESIDKELANIEEICNQDYFRKSIEQFRIVSSKNGKPLLQPLTKILGAKKFKEFIDKKLKSLIKENIEDKVKLEEFQNLIDQYNNLEKLKGQLPRFKDNCTIIYERLKKIISEYNNSLTSSAHKIIDINSFILSDFNSSEKFKNPEDIIIQKEETLEKLHLEIKKKKTELRNLGKYIEALSIITLEPSTSFSSISTINKSTDETQKILNKLKHEIEFLKNVEKHEQNNHLAEYGPVLRTSPFAAT